MMRLLYFILFLSLISCSSHRKSAENSSVEINNNNSSENKISAIKFDEIKKNKKENSSLDKNNNQKGRRSKYN